MLWKYLYSSPEPYLFTLIDLSIPPHSQILVDSGADVHLTHLTGATALEVACQHGHVDNVNILLKAGASINHVNKRGWTALGVAAAAGQVSGNRAVAKGDKWNKVRQEGPEPMMKMLH